MNGFGGWCIKRVANGVCYGELVDNVGKGDVIMLISAIVLLMKGSKGSMKVTPILVESCFINVGKQDRFIAVGVKAEMVRSHLVDLDLELFHDDWNDFCQANLNQRQLTFKATILHSRGCLAAEATGRKRLLRQYLLTPLGLPSVCFSMGLVTLEPMMEVMASAAPSLVLMMA